MLATTVAEYLASVPAERRAAISAVRNVVRKNLGAGYEEGIQYGMIGWFVPHAVFPAGYHTDPKQPLPFAALASQKNHMALYLMGMYCGCTEAPGGLTTDAQWFRDAWAKTGKKLDMGKACLRFKKVEDLALDVVGEAIRRIPAKTYVRRYVESLAAAKSKRAGTKPSSRRAARTSSSRRP
ncbi:MAG TPA: DUF1801 domain-containing protein [Polyangiaceae bacterium]